MINKLHDHIILELRLNERSNIIFVLSSIVLNFIILAINSAISGDSNNNRFYIMIAFSILILSYSTIAIIGVFKGKKIRKLLADGLMKLYKDSNISEYYNIGILLDYNTRYYLLILSILITGLAGIVVPFLSAFLLS